MHRPDALTLANTLDEAWHDQPRSFEREALTRPAHLPFASLS